jgi:hypothetical protein
MRTEDLLVSARWLFLFRKAETVLPVGRALRARIMGRQIRVEYARTVYPSPHGATISRRFIAMMPKVTESLA